MMIDDRLPEWIGQARRAMRRRGRVKTRDDAPAAPQVGDLRLALGTESAEIEPRLVFVVGVDRSRGVAEVALASNESDLASDSDVIVTRDQSGLPFDLVIEVGIRGRVWLSQIGRLVTKIPFPLSEVVRRAAVSIRGVTAEYQHIVRASDPQDQRVLFRMEERASLEAIADRCRESLESDASNLALVVDPVLLASLGREGEQRDRDFLLGIAERIATADISMVPNRVLATKLGNLMSDDSAFDHYGVEGVRALTGLFERALADPPLSGLPGISFRPRRKKAAVDNEIELEGMVRSLVSRGHRRIRLLTDPGVWAEPSVHSVVAELPSQGATSMRLESLEVSP
jgi:hypothetical protein